MKTVSSAGPRSGNFYGLGTYLGLAGALLAMGETGLIEPNGAQIAAAVVQARELTSDGKSAQATISFEAGRTTLGPVAIGPAPKVY